MCALWSTPTLHLPRLGPAPTLLPSGHPVALDRWRHLHGDPGAIVEMFEHVMALGFLESPPGTFLYGPGMGSAVWMKESRALSQP